MIAGTINIDSDGELKWNDAVPEPDDERRHVVICFRLLAERFSLLQNRRASQLQRSFAPHIHLHCSFLTTQQTKQPNRALVK